MNYLAPYWLPGGHLQTIYPALYIRKPEVPFRRERWMTPDSDFIDVDFIDGDAGKPFVVLFHGLEGSSDSHYARALMDVVRSKGWSGAVPHFRGCSGELNQAPRFYHSGDAQEIDWIVQKLQSNYRANNPGNPISSMQRAPSRRHLIWQRVAPRYRAGLICSIPACFYKR